MCKKILVATLAVVVALVVVSRTRVGSHVRHWWKQSVVKSFEESVAPETEISRLRMELDNLAREDDKHFDRVARQMVEVGNLEEKVKAKEKTLTRERGRIVAMKKSLEGEARQVTYGGTTYDRDLLSESMLTAAERFKADKQEVESLKRELLSRQKKLEISRKKLSQLKLMRQEMKTELQRLETALAEEREAQAAEDNTLDDGNYRKIRKEMNSVRDRIQKLKNIRQLKGEVNDPVERSEEVSKKKAELQKFIDKEFGDVEKQ